MKKLIIPLLFICSISFGQEGYLRNGTGFPIYFMGGHRGSLTYTPPYDSIDNYAYTVDGNNYLQIVDNDSLSFVKSINVDKPFYLSGWFKLNQDNTGIFSKTPSSISGETGSLGEYKVTANSSNGVVQFTLYDSLTTVYIARYTNTGAMTGKWGAWTHIVVTYDGSKTVGGLRIYINNVRADANNLTAGSYNGMLNTTHAFKVGYADATFNQNTNGQYMDIRVGTKYLSANDVDSLYHHKIINRQLIMLPCTEGNGRYVKNVANDNILFAATNLNDVNKVAWNNKQTTYDYNNTYGYTKLVVDGKILIYPYKTNHTPLFTPIYGYLLWGQSNAYGLSVADSLTRPAYSAYAAALNANLTFSTYYHAFRSYMMRPLLLGTWTVNSIHELGVDPLLGLKYKTAGVQSFVLKHAVGSTALDSTASVRDWCPGTHEEYADAILRADSGLIDIVHRGKNPFVKSWIWIQGEQDAISSSSANKYQTNLERLYDSVQNKYGEGMNVQLVYLGSKTTATYKTTVRAKEEAFFAAHSSAVDTIITDRDSYTDNVTPLHYDHKTFIRFANVIYNNTYNISLPSNRSWIYIKWNNVSITNNKP